MDYDVPIESQEHAEFCKHEACRRYEGRLVRDQYRMYLVKDALDLIHTDDVLRAVSDFEMDQLPTFFTEIPGYEVFNPFSKKPDRIASP